MFLESIMIIQEISLIDFYKLSDIDTQKVKDALLLKNNALLRERLRGTVGSRFHRALRIFGIDVKL